MGRTKTKPSKQNASVFGIPFVASDALLIALVPVLIYGAAYINQLSTLRYFNVPLPTGSISTRSIYLAVLLLGMLLIIAVGLNILSNGIFRKQQQWFRNLVTLHFFIITITAYIFYWHKNVFCLIGLVLVAIAAIIDLDFRRLIKAQRLADERSSFWLHPSFSIYTRVAPGQLTTAFFLIGLFLLVSGFIEAAAQHSAATRRTVVLLDSNPSEVLLHQNDDLYVFGTLIEGTKQLSNRFTIVSVSPEKPLILRSEESGPILPSPWTPIYVFFEKPLF